MFWSKTSTPMSAVATPETAIGTMTTERNSPRAGSTEFSSTAAPRPSAIDSGRDDQREERRVRRGAPEQRVAQQPRVVVEADEDALAEAVGALEADDERPAERQEARRARAARGSGPRNAYAVADSPPTPTPTAALVRPAGTPAAALLRASPPVASGRDGHGAIAAVMPSLMPRIVVSVLWPPTNASSSWSLSTVMIVDIDGRGDLRRSPGPARSPACPTKTGESSGRTRELDARLDEVAAGGQQARRARRSRASARPAVMKLEEGRGEGGVLGASRSRRGRCPRSHPPARSFRGGKVAPHSKSSVVVASGMRNAPPNVIAAVWEKKRSLA